MHKNSIRARFLPKLLCLFLLAFSAGINSKAQSYWENIDYYTTRNGLANNIILSLFQDSKGFLWIGTNNGLCRYDGKEFKLFSPYFLKSKENWTNAISVINEDKDKNLWIGTRAGIVACLNNKTNQWKWFKLEGNFITSLYFGADGTKWVGTKKGPIGKIENDSFVQVMNIGDGVNIITPHSKDSLLITGGKMCLLSTKTYKSSIYKSHIIPTDKNSYYESTISNGKNLFYFLNNKTVESVVMANDKRIIIDFEFNVFENQPGVLDNGNLLLINAENLAEITPEGEIVYQINLKETSSTLKGNAANCLIEDASGLIWIGTNAGLFKVDRRKTQFKKYTSNTLENPIKYNYIRSLYTIRNELWIGTKEGEVGKITFDTITGRRISQTWYPTLQPNGLPDYSYTINKIFVDEEGTTWVGGSEQLYRKRKNETIFKKVKVLYKGKPYLLNVVWAICPAKPGYILIGTATEGMVCVNTKTMEAGICTLNGQPVSFSVWNIYKSSLGELWAGTRNGFYKILYDTKTKNYTLHNRFVPNNTRLWQGNIWGIAEDSRHRLWVGSSETGITVLNPKTGEFKEYDETDGLVSNITSGIIPDRNGNIWISTVNGLSKLEVDSNRFTNFMEADGLLNNDFNFNACALTVHGEIYLGTKIGLMAFYPATINYTAPDNVPVEITAVKVKGYEINYTTDSVILLPYNQNDISLRFAILEYRKEFHHTYKYRLEGYQTEWQTSNYDNPLAVYTNLPPGKYTFTVHASANGTLWSKKHASVTFIIKPALWQRPYFWALIIILIVTIIIIIVRSRIKAIIKYEREKARLQKAMAELEMKALRAQMNPHFIFNAIGAIQHYVLKKDTLQANEYLSRFAKLMRIFLESSRNNYTTLENEVSMLSLYLSLEKLRFDEKFDYTITLDSSLQPNLVQIPSMLLQPFVENAVNHGIMPKTTKGSLTILFTPATNNTLLCVIEDDGVGREKAGQIRRAREPLHISRGNDIVQERVKTFLESDDIAIKIDIIDKFDNDGLPCGTIVEVTVPYK